ncbi:MAG: CoA transferase, partial [Burkholderiaceae bacterium]
FLARQMFEQHAFNDGTPIKLPAISPKLSATPGQTKWLGPVLGEHNDEILRALGYDDAALAQLRRDGVV